MKRSGLPKSTQDKPRSCKREVRSFFRILPEPDKKSLIFTTEQMIRKASRLPRFQIQDSK